MPVFTYHCTNCGLRFDAMRSSEESKSTACKRCSKGAERVITAANFKFAHKPEGPRPQNTGASSVDHNVDVIIGRSAEENTRVFQARQDRKRQIIASNNTTGDHLSRLEDGDYFVMTEQERIAAKKARLLNQDAMHKIKAWKESRRISKSV